MKAIIVAGGKGSRLQPITNTIPKSMITIGTIPIMEHIINLFKQYGIRNFIFALCYLPKVITSYFGDGSKLGVNIQYVFEKENSPMGTSGAIISTEKFIKETFIVTYADILRKLNISEMIMQHQEKKALATINVYKRKSRNAKSCVNIEYHGRVIKFIEHPTMNDLYEESIWANGSFYIFEPKIFQYIPKNKPSDFGKNIFPKLIKEKKLIFAYPSYDYFMDIGNLEKLDLVRETFYSKSTKLNYS